MVARERTDTYNDVVIEVFGKICSTIVGNATGSERLHVSEDDANPVVEPVNLTCSHGAHLSRRHPGTVADIDVLLLLASGLQLTCDSQIDTFDGLVRDSRSIPKGR